MQWLGHGGKGMGGGGWGEGDGGMGEGDGGKGSEPPHTFFKTNFVILPHLIRNCWEVEGGG